MLAHPRYLGDTERVSYQSNAVTAGHTRVNDWHFCTGRALESLPRTCWWGGRNDGPISSSSYPDCIQHQSTDHIVCHGLCDVRYPLDPTKDDYLISAWIPPASSWVNTHYQGPGRGCRAEAGDADIALDLRSPVELCLSLQGPVPALHHYHRLPQLYGAVFSPASSDHWDQAVTSSRPCLLVSPVSEFVALA